MILCNEKDFDSINHKSISTFKSNKILGIFKRYSFCFPYNFKGAIEDLDVFINNKNIISINNLTNNNNAINCSNSNGYNYNANANLSEMGSLNTNNFIDDYVITNGNGFVQDLSLTIFIPLSRKIIKETKIIKNEETKNTNT